MANTKTLKVVRWCGWDNRPTGTDYDHKLIIGGFFECGMRWSDYSATWDRITLPYIETIRTVVLKEKLRIGGNQHQKERVPIFSDRTIWGFSCRAWGDLMAAIWSEEENKDYSYMDFYM